MLTSGHRIVRTLKLPIIFEKVCPFRPNFAFCSQEKLSRNTKHSSEKPSRQQIRSMLPRNSSNWDDSIVEIQSNRYHVKTKSAAFFFFFSSFPSPRSFFFSFLFLRYCDSGASRAWESCLLTPFHSNDCKLRWVGFQKNRLHIHGS